MSAASPAPSRSRRALQVPSIGSAVTAAGLSTSVDFSFSSFVGGSSNMFNSTLSAEASEQSEPGHSEEAAHHSVARSLFNLNVRECILYH